LKRTYNERVNLTPDPACRLLTLVGPVGIGKTRLALQAADALTNFEDGVFFVGLDSISSPNLLATAIAQCATEQTVSPTFLLGTALAEIRSQSRAPQFKAKYRLAKIVLAESLADRKK